MIALSWWMPEEVQLAALALVQLSGGLAVCLGVRRHRPAHRTGWHVLCASGVLFGVGAGIWFFYAAVLGQPFPYPGWPDLFIISATFALAAGVALLLLRRSPARQVPALLDALLLAVGLAYANWVFLTGPALEGTLTTGQHVLTIAYPALDVAIVALAVRLVFTAGMRTVSMWLLTAGVIVNLAGDTAYAMLARTGSYQTGALPEKLWMPAQILLGAAALHPSMRQVAVRTETDREGISQLRLSILVVGILFPAVMVIVQALTGRELDTLAAAVAVGLVATLIIGRVLHLAGALRNLAVTDVLTGLANREALLLQLNRCVAQAQRNPDRSALLMIDLDDFKLVNDTHGHQAGDQVLRTVAIRLRELARGGDTISRQGGDEFALLCEELATPSDAERIAQRVVTILSEPYDVKGGRVVVGASVGIAHLTGADPETVLHQADLALYAAKATGRGRAVLFGTETASTNRLD